MTNLFLNRGENMNRKSKVLVFLILILALTASAFAQDTISPEDASKFIGQQKTVCGTVASANYATRSKGQPTFLNLDKPYPHQVFTVLIWGSDRSKFEKPPETLSGKEICVTGMIQSYRGRPEIIVKEPSQIKIR
jgi:DNA/RNA endonuclease YhcR with UshA esterase domain